MPGSGRVLGEGSIQVTEAYRQAWTGGSGFLKPVLNTHATGIFVIYAHSFGRRLFLDYSASSK